MRAILYYGPGLVRIQSIPEPPPLATDWVRVRVDSAGLCGSDIQKLLYESVPRQYLKTQILGHEIAGTVVQSNDAGVADGDRVAINPLISCGTCDSCLSGNSQFCERLMVIGRDLPGGFAETVDAPASNVHKLPPHVPFTSGALLDVVAVGVHAIRAIQGYSTDSIAIVGDGPVGLLTLAVARAYGFSKISLLGRHDSRLSLAHGLGADSITNVASTDLNKQRDSFNIVIEAAGGAQSGSLATCIKLAKPTGVVMVLGVFPANYIVQVPLRAALQKELRIIGCNSHARTGVASDFSIALNLVSQSLVDPNLIISHRLPLTSFEEGLALVKDKDATGAVKIVFAP